MSINELNLKTQIHPYYSFLFYITCALPATITGNEKVYYA